MDFIVYGKNVFWAIEVENSPKVRDENLRGLKTFAQDYPQSVPYFLYRGKERFFRQGIHCLPIEDFLEEPPQANAGP